MLLKDKIRKLSLCEWCSMMIENCRMQNREVNMHERITDDYYSIRSVMDASQCWCDTPQDDDYWRAISYRL